MDRFQRALTRKCIELDVGVPVIEPKKLGKNCPKEGTKVLYFFVNHGELTYIGMSKSFQKRVSRHRKSEYNKLRNRTGVYYIILDVSYRELREREAALIRMLQPRDNLQA